MKNKHLWILSGLILLLAGIYGYQDSFFLEPQSSHTWRQTQGTSIAYNYYLDGMDPTHPRQLNRYKGEGHSVGEFTGLYYLAAIGYQAFGYQDWILRFIHWSLVFFGLLAVYKIALFWTKSPYYSAFLSLLCFTSPVLVFYGNNNLPDPAALGSLLIGWAFIFTYWKEEQRSKLLLAFSFFLLAGLLKPTMLISFGALFFAFLVHWLNWAKLKDHPFHEPKVFLLGSCSVLLGVGLWVVMAKFYNGHFQTDYFLAATNPIWDNQNMNHVIYTLFRNLFFWADHYFWAGTQLVFWIGLGVFVLGKKETMPFYQRIFWISLLGNFLFCLLWYYQFIDHEYYIFNLFFLAIWIFMGLLNLLRTHYRTAFDSLLFRALLIPFLVINVYHAKQKTQERYGDKFNDFINQTIRDDDFKSYFNTLVEEDATIVSVPDRSPNNTLFLLKRPGFTEWVGNGSVKMNQGHMREFIDRGASYLILSDTTHRSKEHIAPFLINKVGEKEGVEIYDLTGL